ncbi:unnamed protein product [Tetraodon nigroviridis]|uniref:(spotted green pufferfish) hypothetical protein n=1 Tax=Tetraodon nigroviridis TaxID=99883 RepID=Q4SQ45_TETNG|nr:unnamed protein product [Tetraodon nigroviridis]
MGDYAKGRYDIHPVCADLQGQILTCYKDNVGKTLNCSSIAALYLQCVNNAKQVPEPYTNYMCSQVINTLCSEHKLLLYGVLMKTINQSLFFF